MNIERPKGILKQLCCFNRPFWPAADKLSRVCLLCVSVCLSVRTAAWRKRVPRQRVTALCSGDNYSNTRHHITCTRHSCSKLFGTSRLARACLLYCCWACVSCADGKKQHKSQSCS